MGTTRRKFILGSGAALAGSALERVGADVVPSTSPPDIRALLESAGFNPDAPGASLMAIIGDTHIFLDATSSKYTDKLDAALVDELNDLTPAISDLVFAGDLITSHSVAIGLPRYPNSLPNARAEFQVAKAQMQRFRPGMNLWAVPGNHDTDRAEVTPDLWIEELGIPPYQRLTKGGVPVFLLNSGHAGGLDPVQLAWFQSETAQIPNDQEILIIAHHPTFLYDGAIEGALRKMISDSLPEHKAPVWIVGGHGHAFYERLSTDKGRRFIQMEVTTGNTKVFSDNKAPGYILLGLSAGKVVCRIFRSLTEADHVAGASLSSLLPYRVEWPFEKIQFPGELFVEGFYDRTERLISFNAADVKFHFVYTQNITYKIQPSRFGGKLSSFLILGQIQSAALPTARCAFSSSGPNGPWVTTPITHPPVSQVYTIPIPTEFRNSESLYVRISTDLPMTLSDMVIGGWGTAAAGADLTGYEKWIATHYRTILRNERTDPAAIPEGSTLSNLAHFAFNIPLPFAELSAAPPPAPVIDGQPTYSRVLMEAPNTFAFARRKSANHPGISAIIEESTDLKNWITVDPTRLTFTSLDATWEEVRLTEAVANGFFRVRLETVSDLQGSFLPWQNSVAIPTGSPADRNANSIDDVMEYGFDLTSSGDATHPYDPARTGNPAGQPNIRARGRMISRIVYARMRDDATPGVIYTLEQTQNLSDWTPVPQAILTERVLQSNTEWEQVECLVDDASEPGMFYRVRVELSQPLLQ